MNYYIQGCAAKADKIKAAFEAKGFIPRIAPMYYGSESVLFFTGTDNYIYETPSPWVMDIIKTHPDYKELRLPVEPKFEVGDWVVGIDDEGDMATEKIVSLSHNKVLLLDTDGCHTKYPKTELSNFHLWTIADAKDGDVLATDNIICIFRKLDKDGYYIISPCVYTVKDGLEIISDENDTIGSYGFKPATKEDRELLFRKMKEAGYQWDADKKELRKIQPHYDIAYFQPFDKVLVRQNDSSTWGVSFFGRFDGMFMCCTNVWFNQCIPYEGNEHLLGTTDPCDEQYINW